MAVKRFESGPAGSFLSLSITSEIGKRKFSQVFGGSKSGTFIDAKTGKEGQTPSFSSTDEFVQNFPVTPSKRPERTPTSPVVDASPALRAVARCEISPLKLVPPISSKSSVTDQREPEAQVPVPFNLEDLAQLIDGNLNVTLRLEDLVVTLVHHHHGLKQLMRLLHIVDGQNYSHGFGGDEQIIRDGYKTCEMVAVQRVGTSVLVAIDFLYHKHEKRKVNPEIWIKYRVQPNGTWDAYGCGLGWAIVDSTNADDIDLCEKTLSLDLFWLSSLDCTSHRTAEDSRSQIDLT